MKYRKLDSLQTMRLMAALAVVQYHLWSNYLNTTFLHPGTDFFIALVGVVAAYSQGTRIGDGRWRQYLASRAVRLYISFIPIFLIALFFKHNHLTFRTVVDSFFFLPHNEHEGVVPAAWMISYFVVFYFVFAAGIFLRSERALWAIFVVWSAGIITYTWLEWRPNLPDSWAALIFEERNLDFIFGYAVGMLLRKGMIRHTPSRVLAGCGVLGIIAGIHLLNLGDGVHGRSLWLGLPVCLLILGIASMECNEDRSVFMRTMTHRSLVSCGMASYVIYLSHGSFIRAWSWFLPVAPMLTPLIALAAVALGAAGYTLWEAPLLEYMKTRFMFIRY